MNEITLNSNTRDGF